MHTDLYSVSELYVSWCLWFHYFLVQPKNAKSVHTDGNDFIQSKIVFAIFIPLVSNAFTIIFRWQKTR